MVYGQTGQVARHARRTRQRSRDVAAALEAEAALAAREAEPAESHAGMDRYEEALRARIAENRQRRAVHAMAKEQSRAVRVMAGLPPQEEKD